MEKLRAHIRQVLGGAIQQTEWGGYRIIGSGGTFATLASMAVAQHGSSKPQIHGTTVLASEVEQLLDRLAPLPPEQRRETPGLNPERADIIVAGLAVVAELIEAVGASAVTVSGFGIRDGLLLEMVGLE